MTSHEHYVQLGFKKVVPIRLSPFPSLYFYIFRKEMCCDVRTLIAGTPDSVKTEGVYVATLMYTLKGRLSLH